MDITIINNIDGVDYISLSDFAKEYYRRYKKEINISQTIKNIPKNYILTHRGRNGGVYLNVCIIEMFFNSRRNIPSDIISDLYTLIDTKYKHKRNNQEMFFFDILSSFLTNMIPSIVIQNQKTIDTKTFDICINNKLLIEFDESHHEKTIENDLIKNEIAKKNNYHLLRIKSNSDYGLEISRVYKKVKDIFL